MIQGRLVRFETSDQGTFGDLEIFSSAGEVIFKCVTAELPWRNNRRMESCAPAGTYLFKLRLGSPKHGDVYEEWDDPATPEREDIKDRDCIQIHAANLAGDASKGYVKQLDGCIAPGADVVTFGAGTKPAGSKDQKGVVRSGPTLKKLMEILGGDTLRLEIKWAPDVEPKGA